MEIFVISPAPAKPVWILGVVCVLMAVVIMALAYTAYASRHCRIELDNNGIRIAGDFWGREILFSQLDVAAARIMDIDKNSDYSLKRRTFGTGLPGYASGWFKLRNNEKALVYLSRRHEVVYVPTTEGYSLLLSLDEPERFVEMLQQKKR